MPVRRAKGIEVGVFEGRVGYKATFEDGSHDIQLFSPDCAIDLADKLKSLAQAMKNKVTIVEDTPVKTAGEQKGFTERVGVSDDAQVGLSKPGGTDENGSTKIH